MGRWVKYRNKITGKEEEMYLPFSSEDKADPNAPQSPLTNPGDTSSQIKVSNVVKEQSPPQYFNRIQAQQDGFSEEEITKYLADKRKQGINLIDDPDQVQSVLSQQQSQQSVVEEPKKEKSLLAKILPIVGGIGGGIIGGATTLNPLGVIAGGAIGSGLGQAGSELIDEEEGINAKRIATETALGGIGGAAGPVLGKVLRVGGGLLSKGAAKAAESSLRGGIHFSPAVNTNAAKAGIALENEIVDIATKANIPVGTGLVDAMTDKVVGSGVNRVVTKGVLSQNLDEAEKVITANAKAFGSNYRLSGDGVKKAIAQAKAQTKQELGANFDGKKWKVIEDQLNIKYKNGITMKRALDINKEASRKLGKSIVSDEGTETATLAQKIEAEVLRNTVKQHSPEIAEALYNQQRNIILREAFQKSAGQNISKGSRLGKVNPLNPLSWVDASLNNQKSANIATKFLGGKTQVPGVTPPASASPALTKMGIFGQAAGQTGARAVLSPSEGGTPMVEGEFSSGEADMTGTLPQQERTVNIQGKTITESQIKQAIIDDYAAGGKNVKALEGILEQAFPGSDLDPLSVTGANAMSLAESGARGLEEATAILSEDPGVLSKQLLPGKFASRKFDSAMFRTIEALLRARSGAAVPEQEVRRYMGKYAPNFGDNQEVIQFKLEQLKNDFSDIIRNIQSTRGGSTLESISGAAY